MAKIDTDRSFFKGPFGKRNKAFDGGSDKLSFIYRLDTLAKASGGVGALADAAGVSQGAIRKWLKGDSEPTRDRLIALAEATGISVGWLVSGDGAVFSEEIISAGDHNRFIFLKSIDDSGVVEVNENTNHQSKIPIPIWWINEYYQEKGFEYIDSLDQSGRAKLTIEEIIQNNLVYTTVSDDSMEPSLRKGDIVFLDLSCQKVVNPGIYAIFIQHLLYIKRLQLIPNSQIEVISDNPNYRTFSFNPSDIPSDLKVLARVIWFGREI